MRPDKKIVAEQAVVRAVWQGRDIKVVGLIVALLQGLWTFDAGSAALTDKIRTLKIGVRTDIMPFSYVDQKRGSANLSGTLDRKYSGYSIEVCRKTLDRIRDDYPSLKFETVEVSAEDRFKMLRDRTVDVLCGNDSIDVERFGEFAFSSPIYLSGTSYAYRRPFGEAQNNCKAIVGVIKGSSVNYSAVTEIANRGEFGKYSECLVGEGEGRESVKEYSDHNAGIDALCSEEIVYYVADIEILYSLSRKCTKRDGDDHEMSAGDIVVNGGTFSKNIYAFVFRKAFPLGVEGDVERDAAIYYLFNSALIQEIAGQSSVLIQSFRDNMGSFNMSDELAGFMSSVSGAVVRPQQ